MIVVTFSSLPSRSFVPPMRLCYSPLKLHLKVRIFLKSVRPAQLSDLRWTPRPPSGGLGKHVHPSGTLASGNHPASANPQPPFPQLAGHSACQLCLFGQLLSSAVPLSQGGNLRRHSHMLGPVCDCRVVFTHLAHYAPTCRAYSSSLAYSK